MVTLAELLEGAARLLRVLAIAAADPIQAAAAEEVPSPGATSCQNPPSGLSCRRRLGTGSRASQEEPRQGEGSECHSSHLGCDQGQHSGPGVSSQGLAGHSSRSRSSTTDAHGAQPAIVTVPDLDTTSPPMFATSRNIDSAPGGRGGCYHHNGQCQGLHFCDGNWTRSEIMQLSEELCRELRLRRCTWCWPTK